LHDKDTLFIGQKKTPAILLNGVFNLYFYFSFSRLLSVSAFGLRRLVRLNQLIAKQGIDLKNITIKEKGATNPITNGKCK
jgi:hypothetical protein